MSSQEQKAEKYELFDNFKILSFNKENPPNEEYKMFRDDLFKSPKTVIIPVVGPSHAGKSTLLNFLTVKDYPLLNRYGRITKKAREMMYFGILLCVDPFTPGHLYKKMKASEFMTIHGLDGVPAGSDDFDMFFFNTECLWTFRDDSGDFFLRLFTLLGGAGVHIYLDKTPMTNRDRVNYIAQSIAVSKLLGDEPPHTISVSRGYMNFDEDDDDDDIDDDEYNEKVYKYFKEQDEKDKPIFISTLKEKVVVDEDKVSILTMPRCDEIEGIAYKRVLKDLAKMILRGAVTCSGEDLLGRIDRAYDKAREYKDLSYGRLSMDGIQDMLFKDFCIRTIEEKEREVVEEFRHLIKDKSFDELKEIQRENNPTVNSLFSKPYFLFERELKKIIPSVDALNGIAREFLERVKRESKKKMKSVAMKEVNKLVNIFNDMKTPKGVIYRLYEANPILYKVNTSNCVTINLIDKKGKRTSQKVNVRVTERKLTYFNGERDVTLNYIFPVGINVRRKRYVDKKDTIMTLLNENRSNSDKISDEDITDGYYFDFMNMKLIPINEYSYGRCSNNFNSERGWFTGITETIDRTLIEVAVDSGCPFEMKGYIIEERGEVYSYDCRDYKSKEVRAPSHRNSGHTNTIILKSFDFYL